VRQSGSFYLSGTNKPLRWQLPENEKQAAPTNGLLSSSTPNLTKGDYLMRGGLYTLRPRLATTFLKRVSGARCQVPVKEKGRNVFLLPTPGT
jgi:hypothetical protein